VIVPDALRLVAPEIAPVLVMPAELLLIPLDAVITPFDVIVPPLVVVMLPDVESVPFSLMDSLVTPPDCTWIDVLVAAFSSSTTNAGAVPLFVKVNDVAVPELLDSSYKVKAISLPVVVVMVLPAA